MLFLPASALRVASIALRNPANRNRAILLTKEQFRYGFGNALSQDESDELWEQWTIPSPGRPLFEAALANLEPHSPAAVDRKSATRGPLLITAGGKDHTVPAAVSRQTHKLYRNSSAITDLKTFADRGHSLTIDSGWREVADSCSVGSASTISKSSALQRRTGATGLEPGFPYRRVEVTLDLSVRLRIATVFESALRSLRRS